MSDQAEHPKRNATVKRGFHPAGSDLPCSTKVFDHVSFSENALYGAADSNESSIGLGQTEYSIVSTSAASGQQSNPAAEEIRELAAQKKARFVARNTVAGEMFG